MASYWFMSWISWLLGPTVGPCLNYYFFPGSLFLGFKKPWTSRVSFTLSKDHKIWFESKDLERSNFGPSLRNRKTNLLIESASVYMNNTISSIFLFQSINTSQTFVPHNIMAFDVIIIFAFGISNRIRRCYHMGYFNAFFQSTRN